MIFALVVSCNNPTENEITKSTNKGTENFQTIVHSIHKSNPSSVGLMVPVESPKNGISWSGRSGFSEKENKARLNPEQPFLMASSIKIYIAATILRLQEDKKISIEDNITKHLSS